MSPTPRIPATHTPKSLRVRLGLSQEEVAEQAGISRPTLVAVEAGAHGVRVQTLEAVAAVLGISASELLAACERERTRRAADGDA